MAKTGWVWDGTQFVALTAPVGAFPNAVAVYNSASPSSPTTGTIWNDVSTNTIKIWTGSAWIAYAPTNNPSFTGTISGNSLSLTQNVSASAGIFTGSISATSASLTQNISASAGTFTGNISASVATFSNTVIATNGWGGTNTAAGAGALGGLPMAITVERTGVGASATTMSFGNGSTTIKGARMPFSGKLLVATLHGTAITGTITVDAYLNGAANTSYRLTGTGSASDVNVTQNWQASPLSFTAGSTLNWYITTAPTAANGYVVTFFVEFD